MRPHPIRRVAGALTVSLLTCAAALTAGAPSAAAATCAHPKIKVLDSLDAPAHDGSVAALGRGNLSAGYSAGVPVYWTGKTVHRVPLPARLATHQVYGSVNAINHHDLMVGQIRDDTANTAYAFSYRIGNTHAKILPGGSYADDVNDSGQIVGGDNQTNPATAYVWKGTTVQRTLTVPAGYQLNTASGINNSGTVIGNARYTVPTGEGGSFVGLVWPADGSAATPLPPVDTAGDGTIYTTEDIDEHGRIVGERGSVWSPYSYEISWDAPYTADGTEVPGLPGYGSQGFFYAVSPTTGLIAGTAPDNFGNDPAGTAEIYTGTGSIRALPPLHPLYYSTAASSAADNGNVGGVADGPDGFDPVIWTCAAQQAT